MNTLVKYDEVREKLQQLISHSIATPELVVAVINSKFHCHVSLYRYETMFDETGIHSLEAL